MPKRTCRSFIMRSGWPRAGEGSIRMVPLSPLSLSLSGVLQPRIGIRVDRYSTHLTYLTFLFDMLHQSGRGNVSQDGFRAIRSCRNGRGWTCVLLFCSMHYIHWIDREATAALSGNVSLCCHCRAGQVATASVLFRVLVSRPRHSDRYHSGRQQQITSVERREAVQAAADEDPRSEMSKKAVSRGGRFCRELNRKEASLREH